MAGMNNPPGTPRDDGEMAGNFLNPFQSESVSTKGDNTPLKLGTKSVSQSNSGITFRFVQSQINKYI